MKELVVTLLLFAWTGMVEAKQNDNAFRGPRGTSDRSATGNRGEPAMVPIVTDGSSARSGGETGQGNNRAQSAFSENRTTRSNTAPMLDPARPASQSFPSRQGTAGSTSRFDTSSGSSNPFAQTNNPTSRFGTSDSSTNPAARTSRQPASATSTGVAPKQPIVYLGLPASSLSDLQQFGKVVAPVDSGFVDRITISDQDKPKTNAIPRRVTPELVGDSLVFKFTSEQLANIDRYSYQFDVPAHLKGLYRTATIEYPPVLDQIASQAQFNRSQNETGFQTTAPRWKLPEANQPQQPTPTPTPQTNPWQRNNVASADAEFQRQQLAREQWLRDKDEAEKQDLVDKTRWLEQQVTQMRALQLREPITQPTTQYPANRYAQRFGQPNATTPIAAPPTPDTNTLAFTMMQNQLQQMQQMQSRIAQLDNQIRNTENGTRDQVRDRFTINEQPGFRNDLASNRRDQANPPNIGNPRTVLSTGGSLIDNPTKTGLGGKTNKEKTSSSNVRPAELTLLWLMLLCSVGLNLYLWFLSRTFYSRYQELADELRETFTATI